VYSSPRWSAFLPPVHLALPAIAPAGLEPTADSSTRIVLLTEFTDPIVVLVRKSSVRHLILALSAPGSPAHAAPKNLPTLISGEALLYNPKLLIS
jgi:hypothetical protein